MELFVSASPDIKEELRRYCELYASAEQACKRWELTTLNGVLIPAINELRCAGHHMIRACLADDEQVALKEIRIGQEHAERAIHDTYDGIAIYYIEQSNQFLDEFKNIPISQVYPGFLENRRKFEDTKRALSRTPRTPKTETDISTKAKHIDALQEVYDNFENAREELNKLKRKDRIEARKFIITFIMSSLGLLVAILGAVRVWLKW